MRLRGNVKTMGDSREYLYLYHTRLLGILQARGFFELEIKMHGRDMEDMGISDLTLPEGKDKTRA